MATTKRVSILASESCQDALSFERTQQQAGAHAATLTGTYWRRVVCGDTLAGVEALAQLQGATGAKRTWRRVVNIGHAFVGNRLNCLGMIWVHEDGL